MCEASLEKQLQSPGIGWGGVDVGRGLQCSQQELPSGERKETPREQEQKKAEHPLTVSTSMVRLSKSWRGDGLQAPMVFMRCALGVGRDGEPCSLSRKW